MSRTAQFAVNAAANYGRMLVQIATLAVLTPYIIGHIGRDDFGLWSLVISALGFLSLLDLGFGTGVVKYVAECHGSGDTERRNRILSTLTAVYLAIAVASGVCIAVLSLRFNQIFDIPVVSIAGFAICSRSSALRLCAHAAARIPPSRIANRRGRRTLNPPAPSHERA